MNFQSKMNEISSIPSEQWERLSVSLQSQDYLKGEAVLKSGNQASQIGFLTKGAVRLFYLTHDGKEFNQTFKFDGELVAGYASLLTGQPASFTIEAIEDSTILSFPFSEMTKLYEDHVCWERLGRKVAEQHFLNKEMREASFLLMDAKTRYNNLLLEKPFIRERVPQYHIASFLGITASAFNRLLKDLD